MYRNLSSRFRITIGIVSIVMALTFTALVFIPDANKATVVGQKAVADAVALSAAKMVNENRLIDLQQLTKKLVKKNHDLHSLGFRNLANEIIVATNQHRSNWDAEGTYLKTGQMRMPIAYDGKKLGTAEFRFQPLYPEGPYSWLLNPSVLFGFFVGSSAFIAIAFYLSVMMQQLDRKSSMPKRVRDALDNLTGGLLLLNHLGRIVLANRSFLQIVDMPIAKVLGTRPSELQWYGEDNLPCTNFPWDQTFETGKTVFNKILRLELSEGEFTTFKVNCKAIGSAEQPEGVMVCFENVTQLDKAKIEVQRSRDAADAANRAKSQFLANMSHEIRTPMNSILGFTDLLQRGIANSPEEEREYLARIHSSGQHLLDLINDILDLSKIEAGKMDLKIEACNTYELFLGVIRDLQVPARQKNISLTFGSQQPLPETVQTDSLRFRQVLTNLIGNAIRFTDAGGVKIDVDVDACTESGKELHRLRVDVIDTGIGMTDEQLHQIFNPFTQADNTVTRRFGGTGLGLSICQRIVEALGGEISVQSTLERGSVFSFYIDVGSLEGIRRIHRNEYDNAPKIEVKADSTDIKLPPCKILVVDDGEANRHLLRLFLVRAGCEILEAKNGQEAIDIVLTREVDLVLMDMQMPVLDGYQATAKLRHLGYKNPVLALTANAMQGDEQKCMQAGCNAFLSKPVNMDKLLKTIAKSLVEIDAASVWGNSLREVSEPPKFREASLADHDKFEIQEVMNVAFDSMADGSQAKNCHELRQICQELHEAAVLLECDKTASELTHLLERLQRNDYQGVEDQLKIIRMEAFSESGELWESLGNIHDGTDLLNQPAPKTREKIQSQLPIDEPEIRQIVCDFVEKLDSKILKMRCCFANKQFTELGELAHWLKGTGATVGFDEFYEPSKALEIAAKNRQTLAIKECISEIHALQERIEIAELVNVSNI